MHNFSYEKTTAECRMHTLLHLSFDRRLQMYARVYVCVYIYVCIYMKCVPRKVVYYSQNAQHRACHDS